MEKNYVFLVEKEEMWADMLMDVLKKNDIPCTALPVNGAGMTMRTGMPEHMKVYVPEEDKSQAEELLQELFSGEQE